VTLPSGRAASSPVEQVAARDRLWVERIRTGDVSAFEAMFRAYKNDLGAFLQRFLRSREAAEEVIQDLFLRIWEQRHEWEVAVPLNIYLFRAARNRAISYVRHQRVETRFRERVCGAADGGLRSQSPAWADERARASEVEDAIELAVNQLPERCREVFCLNRYHHLSYAEVAQAMGISVKTVEVQMGRALTVLRERLASWRG
jgi:RNA polymerase sigma-70 factor (ECF subfamily)